ncbi:hypothetical protein EVAR_38224_1 [Eumeta japonica]|uniref:Uncharacterized protein n=1 Tax=Eumeta variegata TaxID=151549 RepID=A0A4C1XGU2_EUMVA|nr:hypothetical protein EVAR_38224_1 [Eumeta japonica]
MGAVCLRSKARAACWVRIKARFGGEFTSGVGRRAAGGGRRRGAGALNREAISPRDERQVISLNIAGRATNKMTNSGRAVPRRAPSQFHRLRTAHSRHLRRPNPIYSPVRGREPARDKHGRRARRRRRRHSRRHSWTRPHLAATWLPTAPATTPRLPLTATRVVSLMALLVSHKCDIGNTFLPSPHAAPPLLRNFQPALAVRVGNGYK